MTDVHNFLMAIISIINATRASNLINMKVSDINGAAMDEKLMGFVFK